MLVIVFNENIFSRSFLNNTMDAMKEVTVHTAKIEGGQTIANLHLYKHTDRHFLNLIFGFVLLNLVAIQNQNLFIAS